jgi:hypothetical protein
MWAHGTRMHVRGIVHIESHARVFACVRVVVARVRLLHACVHVCTHGAAMVQPCCNAAKLPDILKRYLQKFSRGAEADLDDLQ